MVVVATPPPRVFPEPAARPAACPHQLGKTHFVAGVMPLSVLYAPPYDQQPEFATFLDHDFACRCGKQAARVLLVNDAQGQQSINLYAADNTRLTTELIDTQGPATRPNLRPICQPCLENGFVPAAPAAPVAALAVGPALTQTQDMLRQLAHHHGLPYRLPAELDAPWLPATSVPLNSFRKNFYARLVEAARFVHAPHGRGAHTLAQFEAAYPLGAPVLWVQDRAVRIGHVSATPWPYAPTAANATLRRFVRLGVREVGAARERVLNVGTLHLRRADFMGLPSTPDFQTLPAVPAQPTVNALHGEVLVAERPLSEYVRTPQVNERDWFFASKGMSCAGCGRQATRYLLTRPSTGDLKHLIHGLYLDDLTKLTLDHIIPTRLGGPNIFANWQPMCASCNSEKAHQLPAREKLPLELWPYYDHAQAELRLLEGPADNVPVVAEALTGLRRAQGALARAEQTLNAALEEVFPANTDINWYTRNGRVHQMHRGRVSAVLADNRLSVLMSNGNRLKVGLECRPTPVKVDAPVTNP